MKFIPLNRNTIALILVLTITVGFFVAGLFKVLDYFIVKALLFLSYGGLIIIAIIYALKSDSKKNRPEN